MIKFYSILLGKPKQLYAQADPGLDMVLSQYEYEGGPIISIESNRLLPQALVFEAGFDSIFDGGTLRYRGQDEPSLKLYKKTSPELQVVAITGDAYLNELRYFIECIQGGQQEAGWDSSKSALEAMQLWEQEILSAETGKVIQVDY